MTDNDIFTPLPKAEVIKAVERDRPRRIPLVFAHWWGEGLGEQYGDRLNEFSRFPDDLAVLPIPKFDANSMGLSWEINRDAAMDAGGVIPDWVHLDEFIDKLPDPAANPQFESLAEQAQTVHDQDRYLMVGWWCLFFETSWGLRGMENLMTDFYLYPDEVHRLFDALCTLYCRSIDKAAEVMKPDGFWTSDDLGHQTQPMMKAETFDEFFKPYYDRIGACLQRNRVHWWLHSCGNNTPLLPSLIDAGVQMFHPVQKHTMDAPAIADTFGADLGFWAGFDVQHILQEGSPEDVRDEVRLLIDTFDRPEGGMCIAAGNGIVSGTPFENIEAFLDEAVRYGHQHRQAAGSE